MNIFQLIATIVEVVLANEPQIQALIAAKNWAGLATLLVTLAGEIVASLQAKSEALDKAGVKLPVYSATLK